MRICSTHESYWTALNKLQKIKYPKLVPKIPESKAEFNGRPSETESDSEGTEDEDKVPASSVIYSSKSSWQPKAGCKIN